MLFAAKLEEGERMEVRAIRAGTLVLTNVSLQEDSARAALYLQAAPGQDMLVVALAEGQVSAYHSDLQLPMPRKGSHTLVARHGNVDLLGHFVLEDREERIASIEEAVTLKRRDHSTESKSLKPISRPEEPAHESSTSHESKQKEEVEVPARRSQRVRNPAPPQPNTKQKKPIKFSSGSKKSLLEMMYNVNDEDDDDESEQYSEESESSSSSSSEQEDSDQTPKRSSKREAKEDKVQRKDETRSRHNNPAETAEGVKSSTAEPTSNENEAKQTQERTGSKKEDELDRELQHTSIEAQMEAGVMKVAKTLLSKLMQELPTPPNPSSFSASSHAFTRSPEEVAWIKKYRIAIANLESNILSQTTTGEQRSEKHLLAENQRMKQEISELKASPKQGSTRRERERDREGEQSRSRHKKTERSNQPEFAYHIPTSIPDFVLKK